MWKLLAVLGIAVLAAELFSGEEDKPEKKSVRRNPINNNKNLKVFISFPIEDKKYRNFLVSQAKNNRSPFSFVDMSVKEPWESMWKKKCRQQIQQCDGMIALLSKNTWHSAGSRWEIKCATEEGVPVVGMHVKKDDKGAKPPELNGKKVIEWSWENLDNSIKNF